MTEHKVCWENLDGESEETITLKDDESICSGCGEKVNDKTETQWDKKADPYCKKCYAKLPQEQKSGCPKCQDKTYIIDWETNQLICISCGHKYPM
jgi:hypothetical protein